MVGKVAAHSAQNICVQSVNEQARVLLEQFLKNNINSSGVSPLQNFYQGYAELDVIEEGSPNLDSRKYLDEKRVRYRRESYNQASLNSLLDNDEIQYIDEDEEEEGEGGTRCSSLQDKNNILLLKSQMKVPNLKKSHTVSSSSYDQNVIDKFRNSRGSSIEDSVDQIGITTEVVNNGSRSPERSHSPSLRQSDSSEDEPDPDRKKKSIFKRTKERLRISFKRVKNKKPLTSELKMSKSESFQQRQQKKKEKKEKNKKNFSKLKLNFKTDHRNGTFKSKVSDSKTTEIVSLDSRSAGPVTPTSTSESIKSRSSVVTPLSTLGKTIINPADDVQSESHTHKHISVHQERRRKDGQVYYSGPKASSASDNIILHTEEMKEVIDTIDKKDGKRHKEKKLHVKESYPDKGGDKGLWESVLKHIRRGSTRIKRRFSMKDSSNEVRTRSVDDLLIADGSEKDVTPHYSLGDKSKSVGYTGETVNQGQGVINAMTLPANFYRKSGTDNRLLDGKHITTFHEQVIAADDAFDDIDGVYMCSQERLNKNQDAMRSKLKLKLSSNNKPIIPTDKDSYDIDYDVDVTQKKVVSPKGQTRIITETREIQKTTLPSQVEADGKSDSLDIVDGAPVAFDKKTDKEKDELFEKIAVKLTVIADNYAVSKSQESGVSDIETPITEAKASTPSYSRTNSLERQIANSLRNHGDNFAQKLTFPTEAVKAIALNTTYKKFSTVTTQYIGDEPGVHQIAMLFHLTKSAVQVVGQGGALALQIKEMSLQYFADKFASWVVGKGGWDSMIEETTSTDSELD